LIASADPAAPHDPEEKTRLMAVLAPRKQWHEGVVYKGAMHGWCPPDGRAYDEAAAEKAWGRMLELFTAAL
ncbi:dienelactone hydrolase family protein, partial [Sphingopyxis terrae subsp. ummariensis]